MRYDKIAENRLPEAHAEVGLALDVDAHQPDGQRRLDAEFGDGDVEVSFPVVTGRSYVRAPVFFVGVGGDVEYPAALAEDAFARGIDSKTTPALIIWREFRRRQAYGGRPATSILLPR